jgi:lipopolysaccharide biosynthesis regulator YciM
MSLWWFLLFLTALSIAWYLGYRSRDVEALGQKFNIPRDYLVGLNFLLNEEPDKAVDVFIKMLEVDSSTVETHLAVGKLFRRRGEVDRAIRIHQNLIARPQLEKNCREQSLYELGQDYMSAGMLDRAERIFLEVVSIREYAVVALRALLDIYQQEKSWENAIQTANKLGAATRQDMQPVVAHYYCELADNAIAKNQSAEAQHFLKKALDADNLCVRASLMLANVDMEKGEYKSALKNLKRIKDQDANYLS